MKPETPNESVTNEVKAKVFAQYLGCKTAGIFENDFILKGVFQSAYEDNDFIAAIGSKEVFIEQHEVYVEDLKLILKPLSSITDEDAIEVAKILKPNDEHTHNSEYGKMYVKQLFDGVMHTAMKYFSLYQFLQSKGYDLPNYHLNGLTLKEAGLCIYE